MNRDPIVLTEHEQAAQKAFEAALAAIPADNVMVAHMVITAIRNTVWAQWPRVARVMDDADTAQGVR